MIWNRWLVWKPGRTQLSKANTFMAPIGAIMADTERYVYHGSVTARITYVTQITYEHKTTHYKHWKVQCMLTHDH